jgi:pre-rRNA-processing protein TSR3
MGIGRNQRVLPLVYAANSVNYGRPYKLNTAEAIAVTLYIVGLKEDAMTLMEPFGYGAELFKINREALDAYSSCSSSAEVQRIHQASMSAVASRRADKEARAGRDTSGCTVTTDYLSGMDLPPSISDGEYDYEEDGAEEEEDNEEEREDRGGHNI